ncbi:MAG: recombinase RecT [Methanocorpusculum sp.]|nr:recombinase RecT [Methanocorpusculum sp.]
MTSDIVTASSSDMANFDDTTIKRAGELLGVPLDRASALRALIIQQDTGLSITRGEICIVEFRGKPQVFVNKNGYLAYATKHPEYQGFKCESGEDEHGVYGYAEVYREGLKVPITVKRYLSEYDMKREPWTSKPRTMIEKVALSQALRMAFPVLGGTYDESEEWEGCKRVVVDPLPTDITVQPEPAEVPKKHLEKPVTKKEAAVVEIYTMQQAQTALETFVENGFNTDVFSIADLGDGTFDRTMIDADFKRQIQAKKEGVKEQAETSGTIISNETCNNCGKRLLAKDVEDSKRFGKLLCPNCQVEELKARAAAKESTKQSEIPPQYVCSVCGEPITKARKDTCDLYKIPAMCTACENKDGGAA